MKRLFLKLALALFTFTLGVSITAVYWLYTAPEVNLPTVTKIDRSFSCFPGLAVVSGKSSVQREYFPAALAERPSSMRFLNGWYSQHLLAMGELPLSALVDEDESYRFLWLRTFHHPVAVHVWRTGVRYFIVAKQLNGRGGYEPGTIELYWARPLTENDWDAFMMQLEHSTFWAMPSEEFRGLEDGAQWIMEGYREGRYHVVDRQSPESGAYHDACLFLLRQSGLLAEIPAEQVY